MKRRTFALLIAWCAWVGCSVPHVTLEGRRCDEQKPCGTGFTCVDGICAGRTVDPGPVRALGASCASSSECESGVCADGICCATDCSGACQTCNAAGFVGTCMPKVSGTTCRSAAGGCDVAETCDGVNADCPADQVRPATYTCRLSAGICDSAEVCSGTSPECPVDRVAPATTVCRFAEGPCDLDEYCTGAAPTCPADAFVPPTFVCRSAAGACDAPEYCTGAQAACPSDQLAPSATVCRPAAGVCDLPESCTGTSAVCPSDAYTQAGTVCRAGTGTCDEDETCTGASSSCPTDVAAIDGTSCLGGLCSERVCRAATVGIRDEFESGTVLQPHWQRWEDLPGMVKQSSGQLTIDTPTNTRAYGSVYSPSGYDLTGGVFSAGLRDCGDINPRNFQTYVGVGVGGDLAYIDCSMNSLSLVRRLNNSWMNFGSTPYSSSQMQFVRLRERGGTLFAEYSATGDVWTIVGQMPAPFSLASVFFELGAGNWTADTWATRAVLDDVNTKNDAYNRFVADTSCSAGMTAGELQASIAGGIDSADSAYGERDFGGSAGVSDRLFTRTVLRFPASQVLAADLSVFQVLDVSSSVVFELVVGPDRTVRLVAPPGGLRSSAIDVTTGIVVPNDGTTSLRLEVSARQNESVTVRANGFERVALTGLSGATPTRARHLRAGALRYDAVATSDAKTVFHGDVNITAVGWLGAGPTSDGRENLAVGKPAVVSSTETGFQSGYAVDGLPLTRWASAYSDPQWIYVDLADIYTIDQVRLRWELAYARAFQVQTSTDLTTWTDIYSTTMNSSRVNNLTGLRSGPARYLRVYGTQRATSWGYSLFELEAFGDRAPFTPIDDTVVGTKTNTIDYQGTWLVGPGTAKYMEGDHYSKTTSSCFTVKFDGLGASLYGAKASHHGIMSMSLNGAAPTAVDQFAPARVDQVLLYATPVLPRGVHTLRGCVTGSKNAASTDTVVAIDRVDIWK